MNDPAKWKEVFAKFDLDNSGEISSRELVCVFYSLGKDDDEARNLSTVMLKKFDKDEDMKVTWAEFESYMKEKYQGS